MDAKTVEVTVMQTPEGRCLIVNGYRVAGPKPWAPASRELHRWDIPVAELRKALRKE